jgi:hypothetical protein
MFLAPILFCAAILNLPADDNGDHHSSDNIQGTETFEARVMFTATVDAPPCASGWAQLEAENQEGTVAATLAAHFQGLPAGDYLLNAVRASDGSTELLAQLSAGSSGDGQEGDDDQGEQDDQGGTNCEGTFQAHVELQIPADLDVTDIAQLVLSDANGTALLVGDVTGATNCTCQYAATVRLAPGAAGPHVHGKAIMHMLVHNGRHSSQVSVSAAGMPANATVNVQINGKHLGQARSGPRGNLMFQRTQLNLRKISTLNLVDMHGRAVGHANF